MFWLSVEYTRIFPPRCRSAIRMWYKHLNKVKTRYHIRTKNFTPSGQQNTLIWHNINLYLYFCIFCFYRFGFISMMKITKIVIDTKYKYLKLLYENFSIIPWTRSNSASWKLIQSTECTEFKLTDQGFVTLICTSNQPNIRPDNLNPQPTVWLWMQTIIQCWRLCCEWAPVGWGMKKGIPSVQNSWLRELSLKKERQCGLEGLLPFESYQCWNTQHTLRQKEDTN